MERGLRLTRGSDYQRAFQEGTRYSNPVIVLYVRPNDMDRTRVGVVTGRRVGSAVVRNRVRRVVREALRLDLPHLRRGLDLVVVARAAAGEAGAGELRAALRGLLERAGADKGSS